MSTLDTAISLTTLANVKTFMGHDPEKDGLWIYSDGTGATKAYRKSLRKIEKEASNEMLYM